MSRMMMQAQATMNQLQHQFDTIGHNLANSQTTAYKSRQAAFSSLLVQQMNHLKSPENREDRMTPDGIRVGTGARIASTPSNVSIGSIKETDRALDTALRQENHFYQIQGQDGERAYTRDGAFYLQPRPDGLTHHLVTSAGYPVIGLAGPIEIEDGVDDVTIRSDGSIYARRGEEAEWIDQLSVVQANRPQLLEGMGENAFRIAQGKAEGNPPEAFMEEVNDEANILQTHALEQANVDVGSEMTDLMAAQRAYQMNARTITMSDQMLGLINQVRT